MDVMSQNLMQEAVALGAKDSLFYSRFFFPRTVRQESPDFHRDVWASLEKPGQRYAGLKIFRDGAKTSLARLFTSKRVAYGISHTILMVSKAEGAAVRNVNWIKRQVQFNTRWTTAFGLRQGSKWADGEIEIIHGVEEYPIYLIGVGMTGQLRGLNIDDFRPDLIVADDVDDEESAGSETQQEKHSALFFGSLMQTLAAPTEAADPRAVLLQTPLATGDIIYQCEKDPRWNVVSYSCFDRNGESTWPSKFPTEFLLEEKKSFISRNMLHVWMREKEVTITSKEAASFRAEWPKALTERPLKARWYISIDPAASDDKDASEFAIVLLAFWGRNVVVWKEFAEVGVMPDKCVAVLFSWFREFPVQGLVVETVAYQKILKWYIEEEMKKHRLYRPVFGVDDKRSKDDSILQGILEVAPQGNLYYHPECVKFRTQFELFAPGRKGFKLDVLDATAKGIWFFFKSSFIEGDYDEVEEDEEFKTPLSMGELCP